MKLFTWIDNFLNKITMYRLVLYYLTILYIVALLLSTFGLLSFSPLALLYSGALVLVSSWAANGLFARLFKAHANVESIWITAFILVFLITPPRTSELLGWSEYLSVAPVLIWASVLAMGSKFILAINKKHFFNPAAIAVVITAFTIGGNASWWIGTLYMMPFVLIGGLLITRKIRRFDLVGTFTGVAMLFILVLGLSHPGTTVSSILWHALVDSPIIFFALVMLTEPLTTPATRFRRVIYAAIVGAIFSPYVHVGSLYSTPELALCIGNIFSFLASPMRKFMMTLREQRVIGTDTREFVFVPDARVKFIAGQYMEWTLDHAKPDARGNRRYFTLSSSPTESEVRLGVKFFPNSSTFKKSMETMKPGDTILAGQLSGDFSLPEDKTRKLVFIAGGIGITPFRSIVRYMIDSGDKRDATLVYSNNLLSEVSYAELFDEAEKKIGMKTVVTLTKLDALPKQWTGYTGFINADLITREVPDWKDRLFYISGPHSLVVACTAMLHKLGVPRLNIHTDYFPGFV